MINSETTDDNVTEMSESASVNTGKPSGGGIADPRPPLDDMPAVSDWLHRRYIVTERDNQFHEMLKLVLQRDGDGQFLPVVKKYPGGETMGICVTAPAREGKSFMVTQALSRTFGHKINMNKADNHILYCRLRSNATAKGVYMDICRATGLDVFPSRMTEAEALVIATHRLKLASIKIIIIDEVHNLIKSGKESTNLFLKSFFHDEDGFCLIAIGTDRLRQFIYDSPENEELAGRLLDLRMLNVPETSAIIMIRDALVKMTGYVDLKVGSSIKSDAYFANKIYDGCQGSFGRCMRLLTSSIIYAFEDGAKAVEAEDFATIFKLQFLQFNSENPFTISNFGARVSSAHNDSGAGDFLFDEGSVEPVEIKRGRKSRTTVQT